MVCNKNQWTPLHMAADSHADICSALLDKGIDRGPEHQGQHPLLFVAWRAAQMHVCAASTTAPTSRLQVRAASVSTVLLLACATTATPECASMLIQRGASLTAVD
jgi:ankyrin repeat protein